MHEPRHGNDDTSGEWQASGESDPAADDPSIDSGPSMPRQNPGERTSDLHDVPSPFLPAIRGYRIRRVISAGGMGTVYEAEQERPRRLVALKLLKPELFSPRTLRRFDLEIQILAALEHPNIARIYEAGTHRESYAGAAELPFYAMELIHGGWTICDYAKHHNLSVRQRMELFIKVCDAVYAGHCRGVVHRDLKPENILVDASGEPKVIDFGVSRVLDRSMFTTAHQGGESIADSMHTHAGQLIGTVRYMSPEQVDGNPSPGVGGGAGAGVDERSDVYALGVVLYELLTEELPYDIEGKPLTEVMRIIREQLPRRPSATTHGRSSFRERGDVETVLLKALEKSPRRRYQTAEDFRLDLIRCIKGEPIEARPPTISYILARRGKQLVNRAPSVSVASIAIVVGLLVYFIGVPLLHVWTPFQRAYMTALASIMPAPSMIQEFEDVRVIAISKDSLASLEELAAQFEIEGPAADNLRSARPLSGLLMERLAEADVAVVAWDLSFVPETEWDERFVEGVKALRARGIPVLVVHPGYGIPEDGVLRMSPVIAPHVGYAYPAYLDRREAWRYVPRDGWAHIILALDQGRPEAEPGFAVKTVAAYRHPHLNLSVRLDSQRSELILEYWSEAEGFGRPRDRLWRRDQERLPISYHHSAESQPELNIRVGDVGIVYAVEIPPDDVIDRATRSYEWVLRGSIDELRRTLAGKIVLIGTTAGDDRHDLGRGRWIDGVHIQAAAVEAMLRGQLVKIERLAFANTVLVLGVLFGVVGGLWLADRRRRGIVLVACALCAFVLLSFALYGVSRYVFNPMIPGIAVLLTAAGVYCLQTARRSLL